MLQKISKGVAKEQGFLRYFTGTPCKYGHISERSITGNCIECISVFNKTHPSISKQYSIDNKERLNTYARKYRKQYYIDNHDTVVKNRHIRCGSLKQSTPKWYEATLIKQLYIKCKELNVIWGTSLQVDHIIPVNPRDNTVCGLHCWSNLQLLDQGINGTKSDNYQKDW